MKSMLKHAMKFSFFFSVSLSQIFVCRSIIDYQNWNQLQARIEFIVEIDLIVEAPLEPKQLYLGAV